MAKLRILIADDHPGVRQTVRSLLSKEADFDVVGEACDAASAVKQCRRLAPDVVVTDLTMPGGGGIPAIKSVRASCPNTGVLVLTVHEDEAHLSRALTAGATGYVPKRALAEELISAVRAVCAGRTYLAQALARQATRPCSLEARTSPNASAVGVLSSYERELIKAIALGHTSREIAQNVGTDETRVAVDREKLSARLGLRTRADFVRLALEYKLIEESL